jgi:hypothetical protein
MKRSISLMIVVISMTLAACAPKPVASSAIVGIYRVTYTAEALRAAGMPGVAAAPYDNTIKQAKFSPDGTFELSDVNAVGTTPILQAQFTVTGEKVAIKNSTGSLGQRCADAGDGTYTWNLEGDRLTLTSVKDNCDYRRYTISALPWTREQ